MLVADTVLQKRYKIIRSVGHGGMGAVYLAKDLRLGSVVALKENFFNDEKMIKAFEHEARLLAGLRHVALPKVFDHFSVGEGQFLVMEYIYGDDFVEMLEKRKKLIEPAGQPKPFEVHEVLPWAEQLLDALDYIHTQQYPIIHRDIKPQNLKLARRNQIILLDFGLAKGNSSQTFIKSTSGSVIGYTPNYAPIEQIQGVGTDPRTDLYSLGATFYHLLTGLAPIASAIRAEAFLGGEEDPLRPPRMFNPKIPPGLSDLIMKALQQHRNNRPPSAAEMLKMLRDITHPVGGNADTTQKMRDYKTTVMDVTILSEFQKEQQEKARQEKDEAEGQRQLEEETKRSREEADARRRKLEEKLRQAQEEAERHRQIEEEARKAREEVEQLRVQEARARQARQEAEKLRRELEEQTREAIEEVERRVLLEEQARKAGEAIEQRKRQEEWMRRAQEAEAQERAREEETQRLRQEEAARQKYIEEQARKAREEEQRQIQAQEQARKAKEEAERLKQQEQERKAREEAERLKQQEQARQDREEAERLRRELEEHARKATEEAQRRKLHEQEALQARQEAQRLKQQELERKTREEAERLRRELEDQERQAREESERRKLQEELDRRVKGEAEMQKALQDWEQMARQEAERKRLLEEQMQQATEEAQHLKQLLQEQTLKASQEAQKRQALEEQADKAAQEAQKRKLLEEQARQATEEAEQLRRQEQERKVQEDSEKKRLQEEGAQLAREEGKRLKQLENLALIAAQESEMFKRQLEEQARRAEVEAEKRRHLEEEVREAERRLVEEQERNAENGRREEAAASWNQTRELIAWDGMKEGKAYTRQENPTLYLQPNEPSIPPATTEPERFIHSLDEEETPNRRKWMIAGAVVIILAIIMIIRISTTTTETPTPAPAPNPALASLISADSYVQIQPGSFMMGSNTGEIDEKPAHRVSLTKGFEMGKYEVTQEQWQVIMGDNPSKLRGANLPVDNISWTDIKNFIEKLNKRDSTRIYRLPFEAEWEYACRAGTEGEYPVKLDSVAWYLKNSENLTHPVGQKEPNAWGLYDMTGNAFEYCQDWYLQNYYSYYNDTVNPMGPPSGTLCPIRGGNYATPSENCRPARRWRADPREKFTGAGFRLVRLAR